MRSAEGHDIGYRKLLILLVTAGAIIGAIFTVKLLLFPGSPGGITLGQYEGIHLGTNRSSVLDQLGAPAGPGSVPNATSAMLPGLRCDLYIQEAIQDPSIYRFCYRNEMLVRKDVL